MRRSLESAEPHPLVDPPCRRCSVSGNDSRWTSPLFRLLLADSITALSYGRPFSDGDLSMRWRTRFRGPHKNVQHSVANPCIPASFSAAPLWCRNCARCTCVGAAAHPKAVFGAFWTSAAAGVRHARCDLSTRILLPPQSLRGALQRCGLLPGPPDRPPMQGILARLVGRYAWDAAWGASPREGPRGPTSPPNCR